MNILLISLLGCLVVALPSASAQKVKMCVKSQNELRKCQHLITKSPGLECHLKSSLTECMTSIKTGDADITTADGENVHKAGLENYILRPVIAEKPKKECCYAVAVVKSDTKFNINDLKGKTSCHSCHPFCRSGGWKIPIGRLVAQNKIPWDGPDDMPLEKAVSQFFSSSCVPGISKALYPNLCQACQGDCSSSQKEKYYGDEGAFQCLKNGHGQVAFVCHDAIHRVRGRTTSCCAWMAAGKTLRTTRTATSPKSRPVLSLAAWMLIHSRFIKSFLRIQICSLLMLLGVKTRSSQTLHLAWWSFLRAQSPVST